MVSPYSYVLNNPIRNIDPDGMDVITSIKTNSNSNSYSNKTVKYTITLTVVNQSGADLSKTMFNQSSGNLKLNFFSGKGSFSYPSSASGKKDIDYNISANVQYKVVYSFDEVEKNDHVMIIAENVKDSPTGDALGRGEVSGQISAIESKTVGKTGANGFNTAALHELGHNLGLQHTNGGLMNENATGSTSLTAEQKG